MRRKIVDKIIEISQCGTGDLLLQSHMKPVNVKKLPDSFRSDVDTLKLAAAQNKVVSLSSNQIQMEHRMFAILNSAFIIPGKWVNYDNLHPDNYRIIINPVLISESSLRLKDFEQCPSIPGLRFHIWNPISQKYRYHTPKITKDTISLEQKTQQLKGFQSRIWDHQVRHLEGILALDPSISHHQVSVGENYQDNPAIHELARNLKDELKLTSEQNMLKMIKKHVSLQNQQVMSPEQIPEKITKQMKGRMSKNYRSIKKILEQQIPKSNQ